MKIVRFHGVQLLLNKYVWELSLKGSSVPNPLQCYPYFVSCGLGITA